MIAIIDYGVGNINAFANVYSRLNVPVRIAKSEHDLTGASKIILPGVGAFDHAMIKLNQSGMREKLDELVQSHNIPVLGICVGMQMLALSSEEGVESGLGYIDGTVKIFDTQKMVQATHLPHMGWNDVVPQKQGGLFAGIVEDPIFYFLHSFYFHCNQVKDTLAVTDYGGEFVSAVQHGHIYGVQFHPEKSHRSGIQLLKNFSEL